MSPPRPWSTVRRRSSIGVAFVSACMYAPRAIILWKNNHQVPTIWIFLTVEQNGPEEQNVGGGGISI